MKILFLTTLCVDVDHEHFFTKNVIKHLVLYYSQQSRDFTFELATISTVPCADPPRVETKKVSGVDYHTLYVASSMDRHELVDAVGNFFVDINPDVIHSNMIEGIDVVAARMAGIPIVMTVHIGGFICPRGGGNGLLRYDNTICDGVVTPRCARCVIRDFPFPRLGQSLYSLFHKSMFARYFADKRKPVWYLTPLFRIDDRIKERKQILEEYRYAHIIAANKKLVSILRHYLPEEYIHLLPHGVAPRQRLLLPLTDGPVKFFILSRIQYSKGIVEVLKAFKGISHDRYELHVIGDAQPGRSERLYMNAVKKAAIGVNVIFHGRLPNSDIETVIEKCHIMIHSTFCHEIYGINISEVLSMGRGVLASKCGGAEMQVENGVNGLLFEPHSVEAIRTAIDTILDNKELIRTFSDNAALPMPIMNYIEKLSEIYDEVARKS